MVCYEGNLYLSSQANVVAASDYDCVTGALVISGPGIVDLSPLDSIVSVEKYLGISDNPDLTIVTDAFPNLIDIGWGISMYDNPNLETFHGFEALETTGDNIDVWYQDKLETLSGFGSLMSCGWSLEIGGNPVLTNIPDFASLETIASSLFIMDNPALTKITGFQALTYLDSSFNVLGNDNLGYIGGFFPFLSSTAPIGLNGDFVVKGNYFMGGADATRQEIVDLCSCGEVDNCVATFGASYECSTGRLSERFCLPASSCINPGETCKNNADCCSGNCENNMGQKQCVSEG